jgi:transposase-like protein
MLEIHLRGKRPTTPTLVHFKKTPQFCVMEKTSRQANQEKWFTLIEEYLSKGISLQSYCQEAGLKKATFSYWLKKHRLLTSKKGDTSQSGFIPLCPVEAPSFGEEIKLRIGAVELSMPARQNLDSLIPLIKAFA